LGGGEGNADWTQTGAVLLDNTDYNTFEKDGGTGFESLSENQMSRHNHRDAIRDPTMCRNQHHVGDTNQVCDEIINGTTITRKVVNGYINTYQTGPLDQAVAMHGFNNPHPLRGYVIYEDGKYTRGTYKPEWLDGLGAGQDNVAPGEPHNNLPPYLVMAYFIYLPHKAI
jgi:hypothetical protein